jgi:hypothetical protein
VPAAKKKTEAEEEAALRTKPRVKHDQVRVDNHAVRSDDDALEGHFVNVVAGPHEGVFGVFDKVNEYAADGYPKTVIVEARDAKGDLFTVNYKDLRPAAAARRGA